jgi:hypothetical protein
MSSTSTDAKRVAREAAQQHLAELLVLLRQRSADRAVREVIEAGEHLQRAIAAFHMEAIRFRIFTIDRFIRHDAASDRHVTQLVGDLKSALEAAGFQTSSKGL